MRFKFFAGTLLLSLSTPAFAENWDFVLTNLTGKTIRHVELAPAGTDEWFKETIDEDRVSIIKNREDHTVHFSRDEKSCKFDIRLTFVDDSTATARGLDVCDYAFAEFSLKNDVLTMKGK